MEVIETHQQFPHLLTPLILPHHRLKNRVVMGSMHTGLEEDKPDFERLSVFYKKRAQGGVSMIITGGFSPNWSGLLTPYAAKLSNSKEAYKHELVTDTVHQHDCKILLQILHAGRYAMHPWAVAPSALKAPIGLFKPWRMTKWGIRKSIASFIKTAVLAHQAGYDGIEIMGSEGYLINQFLTLQTNHRLDEWGGDIQHRMRFALDIVRGIRARLGEQFMIVFRLSMLDLVPEGSAWPEIVMFAKALEQAGVTMLNTGIGWHEARIPTIASMVPAAAFVRLTAHMKKEVALPLIAANRINTPAIAESIIAQGHADMVAMARPLLADPNWVEKAYEQKPELINVCIACNQACLDQVFQKKVASCLVNPEACRETELIILETHHVKKLAVIGAGPAGLAFAKTAAMRGHQVTLFEKDSHIGGQFNLAKLIPGKEEYSYTIDYFEAELKLLDVDIKLNTPATFDNLADFDECVFATGVRPRIPNIQGIEHPMVMTYNQALLKEKPIGLRVAIIGAGGIGIDLATSLSFTGEDFYKHWGIDLEVKKPGGLQSPKRNKAKRTIYLLQRKKNRIGAALGKTTGWIHRLELKNHDVQFLTGISYTKIDDEGLHLIQDGKAMILSVDSIILCAGQEEEQGLYHEVLALGKRAHLIGGAYKALELDAKQAIEQATRLGAII